MKKITKITLFSLNSIPLIGSYFGLAISCNDNTKEKLNKIINNINAYVAEEYKYNNTPNDFVNQDYNKLVAFSNYDKNKYELNIFKVRKKDKSSVEIWIELKKKNSPEVAIRKIIISGFKSKSDEKTNEELKQDIDSDVSKISKPIFKGDENNTLVNNVKENDFEFEGFDKNKYDYKLLLNKEESKLGILKISIKLILKSNPAIESKYKKFVLDYFKKENISENKEYFANLEQTKGLDKLPYEISNDELKANHATPITVNYLNDGDTFSDTKGNKYRFSGVDTPESWIWDVDEDIWVPTKGLQKKYATLAYQFTEYYVLNGLLPSYSKYKKRPTQIYVVPQKTKNGKTNISDSYGRIVAIIYYKDEFGKYHCLNEKLILEGKATMKYISLDKNNKYYTSNTQYFNLLKKAETKSKQLKKGVWSEQNIKDIFPW